MYGAVNMLIEVYQWIRTHHPYWERNQGRDHIIVSETRQQQQQQEQLLLQQ